MLSPLEAEFLRATHELVKRQAELLPQVADALGVEPYRYWVVDRFGPQAVNTTREQRGQTRDGQWRWAFHGLELDVWHAQDRRQVRIDFGPGGRAGVFTSGGVGQLVCTARAPWPTSPTLKAHLLGPQGHADDSRTSALCDALFAQATSPTRLPGWSNCAGAIVAAQGSSTSPSPSGRDRRATCGPVTGWSLLRLRTSHRRTAGADSPQRSGKGECHADAACGRGA